MVSPYSYNVSQIHSEILCAPAATRRTRRGELEGNTAVVGARWLPPLAWSRPACTSLTPIDASDRGRISGGQHVRTLLFQRRPFRRSDANLHAGRRTGDLPALDLAHGLKPPRCASASTSARSSGTTTCNAGTKAMGAGGARQCGDCPGPRVPASLRPACPLGLVTVVRDPGQSADCRGQTERVEPARVRVDGVTR
jgi:hypothetical protein